MDGSVELGLTEGLIEAEELESETVFQDESVAIANARHPLLKKAAVSIKDLAREPFIMRKEGSGTRAVVERALRKKGLKIKPLLSSASPEAIKNAVACGLGIAIVPLKDFSIHRPLHPQRLRDRAQSPALTGFLNVMEECKRRHFGAPAGELASRPNSRV